MSCNRPKLTAEEGREITLLAIFAIAFIIGVTLVAYGYGCATHGLC